jgi:diguanylate cyclase (GGDEF)-like protein/PAS domain S-box-containing protein
MASETPPKTDKAAAGKRGRALLASERAVGLILENTSDLVALLDIDGVRLYNNPSYHALFGERDLTGTDSFREIHPDDRERVRELFRATVATGVGQRTRYRFLLEDGSVRHIESQGNVVRAADGQVAQVVVIARDVTEHILSEQALQDANRQLRATVQELEQRNRENALLGKVGDLLQMCKSAEEANGVLAHYVGKLFPGACGSFYHLNPGNNLLEAVVTWGADAATDDPVIAKEDCWALRSGQLHSVDGPGAGLSCQHLSHPAAGPSFCAPITAQGEVLGMLHVRFAERDALDARNAQPPALKDSQPETRKLWVLTVSEHLSLALANLKLRETLRMQAVRDALTGLYNRRYMEHALEREVLRAARNRRTVGLIMLDLDHFKRVNDSYGHEVGDLLLRSVGEFLLANVRAEDIACRYGGEEFVVLLPEATLAMTQTRAEQLWRGIQGLTVNVRGALLRALTTSVGVAAYPEHGSSLAELLRAADVALYSAKREGRDRVIVAQKP